MPILTNLFNMIHDWKVAYNYLYICIYIYIYTTVARIVPFALRTSTWAGFTTLPDKRFLCRSTSYTLDHHEQFQTVSDLLCLHHLGHQLGNGFLSKRRQCDAQFLPNDHGRISISEILWTHVTPFSVRLICLSNLVDLSWYVWYYTTSMF